MTKPFIKQRLFSRPFLAKAKPGLSSKSAGLPLRYLNEISCFETLRAYNRRVFCLDDHLKRLYGSCNGIGKPLCVPFEELRQWVNDSLKESGLRDAVLRFSVHPAPNHAVLGEGILLLIIREFKSYPREWYEKGVSLKTAVSRRWTLKGQDPQLKVSQYVSGVLAFLDEAGAAGRAPIHEFIFLGQTGTVAEGTISNVFIVKEKRLLTPHAGSGILRGVTRNVAIDLARKRGLGVIETYLTRHEVYSADECFMTNTSSEVLPVVSVDGRKIGNGSPGPVTGMLMKDFKGAVGLFAKGKHG